MQALQVVVSLGSALLGIVGVGKTLSKSDQLLIRCGF
jgi:hypothetical protein